MKAHVTFEDWTQGRAISSWGTNAGATALPFQTWRHFKEAFAPELVARALSQSKLPVKRCLDPFGGSGITALTCQFLGVHPLTIEVNPFLADLIEAKLTTYDTDLLARDFGAIVRLAKLDRPGLDDVSSHLPPTFVEPGVKDRWLFDRVVANRIAAYLTAIDNISEEKHHRLFRVLLGGVLIEVSNVVVNGKGRRYRRRWDQRHRDAGSVDQLFYSAVRRAISEIHRFAQRDCTRYDLLRGDCRTLLHELPPCELAVFSPPYPNSFDYTDVYNVELWMLGYLTDSQSNRALRGSTFCSHVQVTRDFPPAPVGSTRLDRALSALVDRHADLWDQRIPAMIGGYFSDIIGVLHQLQDCISSGGSVWMVVGDSRYADVRVEAAEIISELASLAGWQVDSLEPFRSMRASAQQGGRFELAESLIVLSRS